MGDFDEYIKGGNPSQREKSYAWETAIGLQDVDGLKPSEYLVQTAKQNIEGDITIEEAKQLIDSYYRSASNRHNVENDRTEEADNYRPVLRRYCQNKHSVSRQHSSLQSIDAFSRVYTSSPEGSVTTTSQRVNGY